MSLTQRYLTKSVNVMCYSLGWVMEEHGNAWVTCALSRTWLQPRFTGQTPVARSILGIDSRRTDLPTGFHRSLYSLFYNASCDASASTVRRQEHLHLIFFFFPSLFFFVSFSFFPYFYFCHPSVICKCYFSFLYCLILCISFFLLRFAYFILYIFYLSILFLNRFYSPFFLMIFIS